MERDNLIVRLKGEAQEQYRIFNQKFVLTNRNPMLGVKVPRMRAIAKEIAGGQWREFLEGYGFCCGGSGAACYEMNSCSMVGGASRARKASGMCTDGRVRVSRAQNGAEMCMEVFFEEVMIVGMVIDLVNVAPGERLQLVAQFVPLIDNWAVCDVFCGGAKWVGEQGKGPKGRNKVPREMMWEFLQGYLLGDSKRNLSGKKEFEIRFGVVMLMSYFLVPEYLERVFDVLGKVRFGDYYVDMGVAWCLATARAKFDVQTQEFVARAGLPAGVVKKYEQKVRDSLRVKKMKNTINEDGKWEVLRSEYLFRRPWLTVRKDCVKLPAGQVNDEFYVLEYPDWVNVIAITRSGEYVMERQYRHGLGVTCYEVCAGVVEPGEEPLAAAKRELLEETGYAGGEWEEIMTLCGNSSTTNNYTHCFVARGVEKVSGQNLDRTEDISVELLSRAQVKELLVGNQITQALMAAPMWRHFAGEI